MSRRLSEARCPLCRYASHEGACFMPDGSDAWSYGYDAGRDGVLIADVERAVLAWKKERASYVKALSDYTPHRGSRATWRHEVAVLDRYLASSLDWLETTR